MVAPTTSERVRLGVLAARQSRLRPDRVLRRLPAQWQMRARPLELMLVPPDLRIGDPSFLDELTAGDVGLAGQAVHIGAASPFDVPPPNRSWGRELYGFTWLRNLQAEGSIRALDLARRLITDWIAGHRSRHISAAGEPLVIARRVMAWITAAGFLLEAAEPELYRQITGALSAEIDALQRVQRQAGPGRPELVCAAALLMADLAVKGRDWHRTRAETALTSVLASRFGSDGAHISRDPRFVLDALQDLLPVRQCYAVRGLVPPPLLVERIERMLGFLGAMRLGDGQLAQFNSPPRPVSNVLASVLSIEGSPEMTAPYVSLGGYQRVQTEGLLVLADGGGAPPLEYSGEARAGALAFALCDGADTIIAEACTATGAEHRATANHSTLCIRSDSSATLIASAALKRLIGTQGLSGPPTVKSTCEATADGTRIHMQHDGYYQRFGLLHERQLLVDAAGSAVAGTDSLAPKSGVLRLDKDLPFAVHFHLGTGVVAASTTSETDVDLTLAGGRRWRFSCASTRPSLEGAPGGRRQIVLRGLCHGDTRVPWTLSRLTD